MKVKHRTFTLYRAMPRKDSGDVRLVRRFIGREACITINAVHGFFRRRYIVRGKPGQLFIQSSHHLQHGGLDQRFVFFFAWPEPLAAIVALERAEKRYSVGGEAGETGFHEIPNLTTDSTDEHGSWQK